ncbi:Uncharacterised protein [Neisseria meningitidis]|uniref:Uncharacterized protein n=1 Tax=Neisseria meningitidis TaxID=487 RepID=A0A378VQ43_NEIME|nr:hypothetical protein NM81858_0847 [Neisseria meningitidis 81858]SUA19120.1 Uncharacterised protein [Neisseria meningitidis]
MEIKHTRPSFPRSRESKRLGYRDFQSLPKRTIPDSRPRRDDGRVRFAISQATLPQILSVAGMPSCFNPPQTKCRLKPDFRRHFRLFPAVTANIDGFLQTRNAVDFQVRKLFGVARHIGFGNDGAFEAEFFRFFEPLLPACDGADFAA